MTISHDRTTSSASQPVDELHRQVERGSLYTHTALGEQFVRLSEMQALLHGLADAMLDKGLLSEGELGASVSQVRAELQQRGELAGPGVVVRVDPPAHAEAPVAPVDCKARMHICNAVCCRLEFALSVSELEAGQVRWDLGRPYFIRHDANGRCVHNDPNSGGCRVYADRPGVCRRYSCADDPRIWKDFARMELNSEWIAANLREQGRPRALGVYMHPQPGADPQGGDASAEDGP